MQQHFLASFSFVTAKSDWLRFFHWVLVIHHLFLCAGVSGNPFKPRGRAALQTQMQPRSHKWAPSLSREDWFLFYCSTNFPQPIFFILFHHKKLLLFCFISKNVSFPFNFMSLFYFLTQNAIKMTHIYIML